MGGKGAYGIDLTRTGDCVDECAYEAAARDCDCRAHLARSRCGCIGTEAGAGGSVVIVCSVIGGSARLRHWNLLVIRRDLLAVVFRVGRLMT